MRTLGVLSQADSLENAQSSSEDFMRAFEDIVEKVSSEQLSDLVARILAGEIRKPGSISRKTLQTVAILDQEIVQTLFDLKPYMLDGNWWIVPDHKHYEWYQLFSLLSSVSITNDMGVRSLGRIENGMTILGMGERRLLLSNIPEKFPPVINGVNLTPTGIELMSVLPFSSDRKIEEIFQWLQELPYFKTIKVSLI